MNKFNTLHVSIMNEGRGPSSSVINRFEGSVNTKALKDLKNNLHTLRADAEEDGFDKEDFVDIITYYAEQ